MNCVGANVLPSTRNAFPFLLPIGDGDGTALVKTEEGCGAEGGKGAHS